MHKTLIVIDMQNDFVFGQLGTPEARAIIPKVQEKIKSVEHETGFANNMVYFTRDTHYGNYLATKEGKKLPVPHCIYSSDGWQIIDKLPTYGRRFIDKLSFGYDSWRSDPDLHKADIIELCGVCTDICVISNALILKAMFPDKEIVVDASCCAGTTPANHKAALQVMKSCQITITGV